MKTREEQINKRNYLLDKNSVRERFDVSVDLSPGNTGNTTHMSGFQTLKEFKREKLPKMRNNNIDSSFLKQSEILRMKPDGFRRISIQTDLEFGGMTHAANISGTGNVGTGLHPLSPSKVTNTIIEDDRAQEEEDSYWGLTESNSSSLLPKTRRVNKQMKIRDSVLQSRNESTRLADILSNNNNTEMAPSIKKALKDRANFYRRKLTFYENLGILATSMTSQEI